MQGRTPPQPAADNLTARTAGPSVNPVAPAPVADTVLREGVLVLGEYPPRVTTIRQRLRAASVGVFLGALVLQGAMAFVVHPQPYPAVRMPAFASAPNADGRFPSSELSVTIGFADGSERRVEPALITGDVRHSQILSMLSHAFRGEVGSDLDPELLAWLQERVAVVDPRPATDLTFCWRSRLVDVASEAVVSSGPCDLTRIRVGR